jgi:hypothetical protein
MRFEKRRIFALVEQFTLACGDVPLLSTTDIAAALGAAAIFITTATAMGAEFSTVQRRQTPSQPTDQTGGRLRARSADFSYPGCSRNWLAIERPRAGWFAPTQHLQTPTQRPRRR